MDDLLVENMVKLSRLIPADDGYLCGLGRSVYNFAYLEWNIVWLTEIAKPGFLNEAENLTAGKIAKRFIDEVAKMDGNHPEKPEFEILADIFSALVIDRDRLVHGTPTTADGGEQRLLYTGRHEGKDWTIDQMTDFSSQVASASLIAGNLLHGSRYETYMKQRG